MVAGQTLELLSRTKAFSLATIRFYSSMPRDSVAQVLGRQLLRSATSVGAQYREAQRAKSIADFVSKTEGALQEIDETAYWLELIQESGVDGSPALENLHLEARQLLSIFVAITKTAKLTLPPSAFRHPPSAIRHPPSAFRRSPFVTAATAAVTGWPLPAAACGQC